MMHNDSLLLRELNQRTLLLDGAMGSLIQAQALTPAPTLNDLLNLTHPDLIRSIHTQYLNAGADIISTNSFNANPVALHDFDLAHQAGAINAAAVAIALDAIHDFQTLHPHRHIFLAASIGPTSKSASLPSDPDDPARRAIAFDELFDAYLTQILALTRAGAHILLIETVFDTLNAKAALRAAHRAAQLTHPLPIMLSASLTPPHGRTLSAQSLLAFLASTQHANLLSVGLNCATGPSPEYIQLLHTLADHTPFFTSAHPNAGLPDHQGRYSLSPTDFANAIQPLLHPPLVNIIGGCCGTTPDHIAALRDTLPLPCLPRSATKASSGRLPLASGAPTSRSATPPTTDLLLAGLERLSVPPTPHPLLFIGERCNVTGSKRFLNLIHDNNFDDALGIARQQLDAGAHILDLNFDDPLLKPSPDACLQRFINLLNNEPDLANLPLMIDSSHFDRIIPALKLIQGRPIVNSISLKDGQDTFLQQADTIRQLGAVPLVIAFDESGQADSFQRKIDIAHRAYNLLTQQLHYPPQDIIFDPCLLAIATGIPEHNTYALDFIQATAWIKQHLPLAKVSAGLSNLSFAFRGNNPLRRAIHSVFLHLAHPAGLDFAIADPAAITPYDSIDPNLTQLITSLIRDDDPQALDRLTDLAHSIRSTTTFHVPNALPDPPQNPHADPAQRLQFNLIHGLTHSLPQDIDLALKAFPNPIDIINGPLMDAMTAVGKAFGKGEMFLPQVIKTARTMKAAVALLQPALNEANASTGDNAAPHSGGTVLFATVKGDVHDIGKNIVSIILACNNFNVVDLGVMVHANTIVAKAIELHPDVICLSGLISPSLAEMADVASALQAAGLKIPLILGGAATSKLHTALVIDPLYDAPVIHVRDAALAPQVISQVINKLLTPGHPNTFLQQLYDEYNELRANHIPPTFIPLTQARQLAPPVDFVNYSPKPEPHSGVQLRKFHVSHVIPLINWTYFFHAWKVKKDSAQAIQLQQDAQALLDQFARSPIARCRAIHTTLAANSIDGEDTILIYRSTVSHKPLHIPLLRQQTPDANGFCKSLADYVLPQSSGRKDVITFFLVSVQLPPIPYHLLNDDYHNLLHHSLADRLAEATAEYLHTLILPDEPRGIRPAIGFPSLPDLSLMMILDDILLFRAINVERSQNGAMKPKPSIAGIYITHPEAHYFSIPHIDTDQLADYILRRKLIPSRTRKFLTALLTHASKY